MEAPIVRATLAAIVAVILVSVPSIASPRLAGAQHLPQDDAGTGADAGDTFATATPLARAAAYSARLAKSDGDTHDWYRVFVPQGGSLIVSVTARVVPIQYAFLGSGPTAEPVTLLDPLGNVVAAAASSTVGLDLTLPYAAIGGDYRIHWASEIGDIREYTMCLAPCDVPVNAPIDTIFGGSPRHAFTRILLVPPAHGDLGNPLGPTVLDYLDATMSGIHRWETALDAFAADHPEYAYLGDIELHVEVFDGLAPPPPIGYDIVVVYVETSGPVFRGMATQVADAQGLLQSMGLGDYVHHSTRTVLLSLLASSPRAGQATPDYPEWNDLEWVTMHEFAHVFGLGHTRTWTSEHGPDLMVSPAAFVYGDGSIAGDGGERTPRACITSLDLYGMAVLYRWLPSGAWQPTGGSYWSPYPYERYC